VTATGETSEQRVLRDPDSLLMEQVRDDVPGAFEELLERYQHRLVGVMHGLIGNAEEAEDLAQEVFTRVWKSRKKYVPKSKFSTWLYTIAHNLAKNCLRSRQRKPLVAMPYLHDSGPLGARPAEQIVHDPRTGPMEKVQKNERAERIRAALDTLNERQRTAVVLNKFEEMDYAGIAEVMGLTTKGVKSLLSRARMNLRVALSDYIYMDCKAPHTAADEDE
jgi:RNA polymerase sigma-70 factor (ECF subfamily)